MKVLIVVIGAVIATFLITWGVLSYMDSHKVTKRLVFAIIGAVFATLFVTLIYANLTTTTSGIDQEIETLYHVDDPEFERAMASLLGPPLINGNKVTTLKNGVEIFPAMLESIKSAKKSITFETFIYWSGEIGKQFTDALSERARAGVKVNVLVDWMGSRQMEEDLVEEMRNSGVVFERFHPLRWYNLDRVNHRTHRKLLIIDGNIGYTGGVGIADDWQGNADSEKNWRDNHYKVEGPVVAQMQAGFMDNWMKTNATVLHGEKYFPELKTTGTLKAQMFKSSAEGGSGSARLMFLMSLACAEKTAYIGNAYFVPDDLAVKTLIDASKRGVDVQIIAPGPITDTKITRYASRSNWGPLLEAGIKIHEYQPTMFHCKYMVIDGLWTSVGSTNFDNRSFQLNDEANLNVLDADFAKEHENIFREDLSKTKEVTFEIWKNRPKKQRVMEWLASTVQSQL